jgi:hypothetical protein
VPLRAAQRWLARYRQGGSTGLACLIRHDAGRPSPGQPRGRLAGSLLWHGYPMHPGCRGLGMPLYVSDSFLLKQNVINL